MKNMKSFGILIVGMLVGAALWAIPVNHSNAKDRAVAEPSAYSEPASADQPHMQAALGYLRQAKGELQKADRDKGGFREAAIQSTNQAIAQTEKGIGYDRRH